MGSSENGIEPEKSRLRRAKTPDERENQLVNLALDQIELQLREGTAPTPVVLHYAKLVTSKNKLEEEKLRRENILLEKRAEQVESGARIEELYTDAISAMRKYQGIPDEPNES